jgi:methyl-accepting chemotaxis protein
MRWFNDLRLDWQLFGAFGAILLVLGIAGGFAVHQLVQIIDSYHLVTGAIYATQNEADNVNSLFNTRESVLKDIYLFHGDAQRVQQATDRITELDNQISDALARLRASPVLPPDELDDLDRAAKAYTDYQAASRAAVARVQENGDAYTLQQEAANLTAGRAEPISSALDDLSRRTKQQAADEVASIERRRQSLLPLIIGILVFSWVLGLAAAALLARNLAHAAGEVASAARRLAEGDLDQEITLRRGDELGDTAASMRGMIAYQRKMAGIADALARGDLKQDFKPRSERDVLGAAFATMIANVRDLVMSIEKGQASRKH